MNTAFIGLDYIVELTHPQGKLAASASQVETRQVIAAVNQTLQLARQKQWLTVLVKVGYAKGYADHPASSPMFRRARELQALESDSAGMAFHPGLQAELADLVLTKPRVSAFYGTSLEAALRANRVERLIIAGVSTVWAVESTIRDAHDRDFEVLLLPEACAATNQQEHEEAIQRLSRIATPLSVAELAAL